jgi:hypothetical protein
MADPGGILAVVGVDANIVEKEGAKEILQISTSSAKPWKTETKTDLPNYIDLKYVKEVNSNLL